MATQVSGVKGVTASSSPASPTETKNLKVRLQADLSRIHGALLWHDGFRRGHHFDIEDKSIEPLFSSSLLTRP
jgi:hypothetical protein